MNTKAPKWLLVSDVDDTLLGDERALVRLAEVLRRAEDFDLAVAYNSSRPCASLRNTLAAETNLPAPDYLIGALGTEIEDGTTGQPLTDYVRHLDQSWERDRVVALAEEFGFEPHPQEYQRPFKASFDVPGKGAFDAFTRRLEEEGIEARTIFSMGKNLDVIPPQASKGRVIDYLRDRLDVAPDHVLAAGDSGNDVDMFEPPRRVIIVGNAEARLRRLQGDHIYHAEATHAAGVLEGLQHWGVVPEV